MRACDPQRSVTRNATAFCQTSVSFLLDKSYNGLSAGQALCTTDSRQMQITVKTLTSKDAPRTFEVDPTETISSFKRRVGQQLPYQGACKFHSSTVRALSCMCRGVITELSALAGSHSCQKQHLSVFRLAATGVPGMSLHLTSMSKCLCC